MARNFRVEISRTPNGVHLHLQGDFDGSSAHVLANTLETHRNGSGRIVVHTEGLTNLLPFGVAVFQDHLRLVKKGPATVVFTGENRERMVLG